MRISYVDTTGIEKEVKSSLLQVKQMTGAGYSYKVIFLCYLNWLSRWIAGCYVSKLVTSLGLPLSGTSVNMMH